MATSRAITDEGELRAILGTPSDVVVSKISDRLNDLTRQFGDRVCLLHTGGMFSLFPLRERLSRLLDSTLVGSASHA